MSDRYANYSRLKIDRPSDRVLRVTFDRPETYNSVDAETHTQLTNIWRDINDDPDISAVIVTGAGKAFSAGGDFEMIKTILENPVARMATWKEAKDLVYNIINCNKPIISAINGVAVGAGLVVGILADVSICGKSARIVDGHTRLGVAAGDVACIIWPLLCGLRKPSTICSLANHCRVRRLSGSDWCHFAWKMPICRGLRSRPHRTWQAGRKARSAGPSMRSTTGCASTAPSSTRPRRWRCWVSAAPRCARGSRHTLKNVNPPSRRTARFDVSLRRAFAGGDRPPRDWPE